MEELFSQIISALLQIIVFTMVPFIFFLFRANKRIRFFEFIGLPKPTQSPIKYVLLTIVLFLIAGLGMIFFNDDIRQTVLSPKSVTGQLHEMGLSASSVLTLLVIAFFKTSLSEEILFRGFIAKQLIDKIGFKNGNLWQSLIFGTVHLVLFSLMTKSTFVSLTFIFVFSAAAGWTIGLVKQKDKNKSVIPGWLAHGLGNTLSYFIIAFVL